jgi:hypothetical protein
MTEFQNRRKLLNSVARLSEEDLRDICLTRDDVQASCNTPLSHDAGQELSRIAKKRTQNW